MNISERVSIIIPVYNEAEHIGACLDAILDQTVQPFEIIVVDNNSTDNTAAIARRYSGVRVIHEQRQGVVHARNTGFNAARGSIIGRIDADTILTPEWVETLLTVLNEEQLDAVTGSVTYMGTAFGRLIGRVDLAFRRHYARRLGREVALQGANMALRRSAWVAVRGHVCEQGGMHEDFDLAIHLNRIGKCIQFDETLVAGVHNRRIDTSFSDFYTYVMLSPGTYAMHGLKSGRWMYSAVYLSLATFWLLKLLCRGYDTQAAKFSWRQALTATSQTGRVNPATFVD